MNIAVGKIAEQAAAAFLQNKGLRLITSNYYCRRGEIDIIAEDGATLVFVEVRRRRHMSAAAESINPRKQQRLTAAATHYLAADGERPCRFDVVLVDGNNKINWLRNAFNAAD